LLIFEVEEVVRVVYPAHDFSSINHQSSIITRHSPLAEPSVVQKGCLLADISVHQRSRFR
jgi:hypothetical protein